MELEPRRGETEAPQPELEDQTAWSIMPSSCVPLLGSTSTGLTPRRILEGKSGLKRYSHCTHTIIRLLPRGLLLSATRRPFDTFRRSVSFKHAREDACLPGERWPAYPLDHLADCIHSGSETLRPTAGSTSFSNEHLAPAATRGGRTAGHTRRRSRTASSLRYPARTLIKFAFGFDVLNHGSHR